MQFAISNLMYKKAAWWCH